MKKNMVPLAFVLFFCATFFVITTAYLLFAGVDPIAEVFPKFVPVFHVFQ